jgi:signal peptidase I
VVLNTWVVTIAQVESASMAPTLQPGETVAVAKLAQVDTFDIVAFDGRGSFLPRDHAQVSFLKRVIGMPGDRVTCCDQGGRVLLNGVALPEQYVAAGNVDDLRFDVIVPPRKVWVMGDNRAASTDSRAFLGAPGGGFVPLDRVTGRVVGVIAPPGEARWIAAAGAVAIRAGW